MAGLEVVAIEEIMVHVAHAGPIVAGIGPGNPRTGINVQREGIEGAAATRNGHVGSSGNITSWHWARAG